MSGKKEEFKSFQIGNLNPSAPLGAPPLAPSKPAPAAPATSPAAEMTEPAERVYPNIEELLESPERLEEVGAQMGATCEKLDEIIAKRSGTAKIKAQKARKAYDHAFDLIDHLMQIKEEMIEEMQNK